MNDPAEETAFPEPEAWPVRRAEELLRSLTGVISARIVAPPGGEMQEIHLLTTDEVSPKQTVRNVESALLAQLGVKIDHRKVSVAQTQKAWEGVPEPDEGKEGAARGGDRRVLFLRAEAERPSTHRIRAAVTLAWASEEVTGEETGADVPRARLGVFAGATLRALEAALGAAAADDHADEEVVLALDGVRQVEAFERSFVLVGVRALMGREEIALAGAAGVSDNPERAAVLATLQATDRWVRGR